MKANIKSRTLTYRQAINEALSEEMRRDPRTIIYGLDINDHKRIFGSTLGLLEEFGPERCLVTPLSEDAMVGFGLGVALAGLRPIHVHIRVDFLLLGVNQLVNMVSNFRYLSAGKLTVPIVFRAVIGRGWGQGAQHSKSLQSLFAHIPGLKVVMPSRPADAKGLLKSSIRDNNPIIFLEHRWLYDVEGEVPTDRDFLVPLSQPYFLTRGGDLTIVATSWMTIEAVKAAEILWRKRKIRVEVIDPRTISPLDYRLIYKSVRKTGHLVVVDYDWLNCGFSAEVASRVQESCFGNLKSPVTRLGFAPVPCPTARSLESKFYPNAADIVREIERKLKISSTDLSDEELYTWENRFKGPF